MNRAAWAFALILATVAGCAGAQRVYFRPAGEAYEFGPPVPAARVRLPEKGDRPLLVQTACLGVVAFEKDGKTTTRAEFEFRAKNKTGAAVVFPVAEFVLRDDEGREIGSPVVTDPPDAPADGAVTIADGERRAFDLVFDVGGKIDPGRVGSVLLRWKVKAGDGDTAQETKFVRYEVRDARWPAPFMAFGARGQAPPYWVGVMVPLPLTYYDPFFEDPWFWAY
jgi:hypothetical protein